MVYVGDCCCAFVGCVFVCWRSVPDTCSGVVVVVFSCYVMFRSVLFRIGLVVLVFRVCDVCGVIDIVAVVHVLVICDLQL